MKGVSAKVVCLINTDGLQGDLHRILTQEHYGACQEVADLLDQPHSTVYSQIRSKGGNVALPLRTLQAAHFVTRSRVLERALVWPGLRIIDDPECLAPSDDLDKEATDVFVAVGKAVGAAREAVLDGEVTLDEGREITGHIDQAEYELRELRALVLEKCPPLARENK